MAVISKKPWFPGVVILLLFIPAFIESQKFTDPFNLPKYFYFFFFGSAVLFIQLLWIFNRKYKTTLEITRLDAALLIFTLYQTLRLLFTPSVPFANEGNLCWLFAVVLYFLIKPFVSDTDDNRNTLKYLTIGFMLIGLGQALYGLGQLADLIPRLQKQFDLPGAFGNPGPYSNFMVVIMPFALSVVLFGKNMDKRIRILAVITLVAIAGILPFTRARASWIALIIATSYLLNIRFSILKKTGEWLRSLWVRIALVLVVVAIIIPGAVYLYQFKEESASGRVFVWKVTLQMIRDKPIFGYGYDTYSAVHNNYQADYFAKHPDSAKEVELADAVNYAFNDYLQITAETGIIGLLIFMAIIFFVFFQKRKKEEKNRNDDPFLIAARASLLVFLVTALFSYPLQTVILDALFIFLLAVIAVNNSPVAITVSFDTIRRKWLSVAGIILLIIFTVNQYKKFHASKEWLNAFQMVRENKYPQAESLFDKLYPTLKYSQYFLFNFGAELSVMGNYTRSIDLLKETEPRLNDADLYIYMGNSYEALEHLEKAEQCFTQASLIQPIKFYPKYRLVKLKAQLGKTVQAKELAREILSMKVKIPSDIVDGIRKEMKEFLEKP